MSGAEGMGQPLFSSYTCSTSDTVSTMPQTSSVQPVTTAEQARQTALQLAERRKAIDEEIAAQGEVLKSNDVTLTSALIDADGFPISTIDIVAVRTARSKIIALRNDRAAIEREMRDLIGVALARPEQQAGSATALQATGSSSSNPSSTNGTEGSTSHLDNIGAAMAHVPGTNGILSMSIPIQHGDQTSWSDVGGLSPFARISSVALRSPAAQADMRVGDEVLQFDHLTTTTAHRSATQRDLANLPSAVREGTEIDVIVLRRHSGIADAERSVKRLRITPASGWGGRGLLGCHLVPL